MSSTFLNSKSYYSKETLFALIYYGLQGVISNTTQLKLAGHNVVFGISELYCGQALGYSIQIRNSAVGRTFELYTEPKLSIKINSILIMQYHIVKAFTNCLL